MQKRETGLEWRLAVGKYIPFHEWSQTLLYLHGAQQIRLQWWPRGGNKGLKNGSQNWVGPLPQWWVWSSIESVLFAACLMNLPWLSSPGLSFQLSATKRQEPRKKNWPNISIQKVPVNYLTKRYYKIISRGPNFSKIVWDEIMVLFRPKRIYLEIYIYIIYIYSMYNIYQLKKQI